MMVKTCPICSGVVIGKSSKIYCSSICHAKNKRIRHPERLRSQARAAYHVDVERSRAKSKEKYQKLKVQKLAYGKKWKARNRGKCNAYNRKAKARRRAIIAQVDIGNIVLIATWWTAIKARRTAICYWCRRTVKTANIQCDHINPISRGGAHDITNLCVSCVECNQSKHVKPLSEWNQKLREPSLL